MLGVSEEGVEAREEVREEKGFISGAKGGYGVGRRGGGQGPSVALLILA